MSKSTKIIAALGVAAGLGIAALPAATFADTSVAVPVRVNIEDTLALSGITTGDFASTEGLDLVAGSYDVTSQTVFTATSNNNSGWHVTVAGTDDTTQQSGSTLYNATTGGQSIAPFSTAVPAADPGSDGDWIGKAGDSGWGIMLDNLATGVSAGANYSTSSYMGVTAAGNVVTSATTSGTAGKSFTVKYGVRLADTQAAGDYKGNITYTIANNS